MFGLISIHLDFHIKIQNKFKKINESYHDYVNGKICFMIINRSKNKKMSLKVNKLLQKSI